MVSNLKVACVIPVYNGKSDLLRLLDSLDQQTAAFDILVVDSSSNDGSQQLAFERVDKVVVIDTKDFNHGGTRQKMINEHSEYDVFVFLTQDAYLEDAFAIENIIIYLENSAVGAVCGRQLPHHDATLLAAHARLFNYPTNTIYKSLKDAPVLGIKTPFMSNSFAAYRREALIEIGGFPNDVILSEDMYATAKMLMAGYSVVYAGNARCRHSHNYTMLEEFRRYFDIGVFHAEQPWIRDVFGGAGGEGFKYVKSELRFLELKRFYLWPSCFIRNALKLLGYKLGQRSERIPVAINKKLSMHSRHWAE